MPRQEACQLLIRYFNITTGGFGPTSHGWLAMMRKGAISLKRPLSRPGEHYQLSMMKLCLIPGSIVSLPIQQLITCGGVSLAGHSGKEQRATILSNS